MNREKAIRSSGAHDALKGEDEIGPSLISAETHERYSAFWECSSVDRPLLFIAAPRENMPSHPDDKRPTDSDELLDWMFNLERVLPRMVRQVENTYYAAEGLPIVFPMSTNLPAIQAGFLGGGYFVAPQNGSGWCDPVIEDLDEWSKNVTVDPENIWWHRTQLLLREARCLSKEGIIVGHPDTQGGGQVLDSLRGTERLAIDLIESPDAVKSAIKRVDETWLEYWNAMNAIIGEYQSCFADWLSVYCDKSMVCPECDFSCMISNAMFEEFFMPSIRFQCESAEYSIYHLDGPGAVQHLDSLLDISSLTGIQWVPGAGAKPMPEWIPLLQRIQAAGKCVHISCPAQHVEQVVSALQPDGLYVRANCSTRDEADELVRRVDSIFSGK